MRLPSHSIPTKFRCLAPARLGARPGAHATRRFMGAAASSPTRDAQRKYAVPVSSPTAAAAAAAAIAPTPVSAPALGPGSAPARAAMAPSPKSMPAPPPVSHPTTLRAETSLLPQERRVKPALRDPRVVPARFVDFAELKDHGRLPRFGSNPKYKHPVTKEGNANMCHFREDFKMRTIFVFVTHFWGTEQDDDDVIAQQEVMPYVERYQAVPQLTALASEGWLSKLHSALGASNDVAGPMGCGAAVGPGQSSQPCRLSNTRCRGSRAKCALRRLARK